MKRILLALVLGISFFAESALATVIQFSGPLRIIELNDAGIYSSATLGTVFTGNIDDVTYFGSISDGTTATAFTCCIAAGPLEIQNDVVLDSGQVDFLNTVAGEMLFSVGNTVDIVDIEGDERTTLPEGRIEVGISLVVDGSVFPNSDPANYSFPLTLDNLQLGLYFINEENSIGEEIYSAIGKIEVIPLPASVWLFGSALGLMGWLRRKVN